MYIVSTWTNVTVLYYYYVRLNELLQELKVLKLAQESTQAEQRKRDNLVEQTSKALNMMEDENKNFQQVYYPLCTLHDPI